MSWSLRWPFTIFIAAVRLKGADRPRVKPSASYDLAVCCIIYDAGHALTEVEEVLRTAGITNIQRRGHFFALLQAQKN